MTGFIIGTIFGGFIGIVLMALLSANSDDR